MTRRPLAGRLGPIGMGIALSIVPASVSAQGPQAPTTTPSPGPATAPKLLGKDDAKQVETLQQTIEQLRRGGKYAEAIVTANEALAICARILGPDHWQTADVRRLLGTLRAISDSSADVKAELAEAGRLEGDAERRFERSQFSEAEPLYRKALQARVRRLGENHPETAASADMLADCLVELGKLDEAAALNRKALETRRRVLGEEHPDTAISYHNVGKTAAELGRYDEAERLLRRARAIFVRLRGIDHSDSASITASLGGCICMQGRYAEAEPFVREAMAIRRRVRGENHRDTAASYVDLAGLLEILGRAGEAETFARKALEINLRVAGEGDADTARSYNILAQILAGSGRFTEAESLFRKELEIWRRALGEDHSTTAGTYNDLASLLASVARLDEAEAMYRKALEIRRRTLGDQHSSTATSFRNLAMILNKRGKYAEAELLAQRALEIRRLVLGEDHHFTGISYKDVAMNLNVRGKYAEAEPLYRRSLAIMRGALGDEHPETIEILSELASVLRPLGKWSEAEALHRKVLESRRRTHGENDPGTAESYAALADCLHNQGKWSEAEALYRKAGELRGRSRKPSDEEDYVEYTLAARNLSDQGKHAESEVLWLKAAKGFERAQRLNFAGLGATGYALERSPLPALIVTLARNGKRAAAWRWLESYLSRGLRDDLSARLALPLDTQERRRERDLIGRLNLLDQQIGALPATSSRDSQVRKQIDQLEKDRNTLLAAIAAFEGTLKAKYGPAAGEPSDLASVQAHLSDDTALIAWLDESSRGGSWPRVNFLIGEHWAAVVRRRGEPVWVRLQGTGPKGAWTSHDIQIPTQVVAALTAPHDSSAAGWKVATRRLAEQRLVPLRDALAGGDGLPPARHLIILTSPALANLPVEVLIESWVDRPQPYLVSYVPSGSVLAWLEERRHGTEGPGHRAVTPRLLAVGDPASGHPAPATTLRGERDPVAEVSLPGSRREVEAIARLFDRPVTLLGSEASEQRLGQMAASDQLHAYDIIHIATHGRTDPLVAMNSRLFLARDRIPDPLERVLAKREVYDGELTAEQIMRTWHIDAELVTLSACETGLGKRSGGEGYLGFSQALFLSGARSVVLSLWKVDDRATSLLMRRFYENMLGKRSGLDRPLPKAEALAEAKAWLRGLDVGQAEQAMTAAGLTRGERTVKPAPAADSGRPFAHPYYWAAFVLVGDPN